MMSNAPGHRKKKCGVREGHCCPRDTEIEGQEEERRAINKHLGMWVNIV